jgi:hypothetical protein
MVSRDRVGGKNGSRAASRNALDDFLECGVPRTVGIPSRNRNPAFRVLKVWYQGSGLASEPENKILEFAGRAQCGRLICTLPNGGSHRFQHIVGIAGRPVKILRGEESLGGRTLIVSDGRPKCAKSG